MKRSGASLHYYVKAGAAMLNNVRNFGAHGNGVDDDRAAIQRAISDAVLNGRGGILFPAGTYRVGRDDRWALDLNGVQDFMVAGEGPHSVVKLADKTLPADANWHVFILRNSCRRVVFKQLSIDGNRSAIVLEGEAEQLHGIEIEAGAEDVTIDGCIVRQCVGDGIRAVGEDRDGGNIRRLRITNTQFQGNHRSGLVVQRALEQVIVSDCIFDGTVHGQSIDCEPSGSGAPAELIITGCIITHSNPTKAVTLSGIGGQEPLFNCKFTSNIVRGGPLFCTDVNQLTIQNNTIEVADSGEAQRIPIEVQRGGEAVLIAGNIVVNDGTVTGAAISLGEVRRGVARTTIADNLCFSRSGNGIQCLSSDGVAIHGNMIVATEPCEHGIFIRSQSSDVNDVSIHNNDITVRERGAWSSGITIAATAPHQVRDFSVIGNSVHHAARGLAFEGSGFDATPVCTLNRVAEDVDAPLSGIEKLPGASLIVGGAANRGAGRYLAGLGEPDNRISGGVGDIFQRLDGGQGTTLYVKESGQGTSSGWAAK